MSKNQVIVSKHCWCPLPGGKRTSQWSVELMYSWSSLYNVQQYNNATHYNCFPIKCNSLKPSVTLCRCLYLSCIVVFRWTDVFLLTSRVDGKNMKFTKTYNQLKRHRWHKDPRTQAAPPFILSFTSLWFRLHAHRGRCGDRATPDRRRELTETPTRCSWSTS